MSATYRAVVLKGKGNLDQLEVRELPLEAPKSGEVRIRVLAAGAGATDITMRTGTYPYRPSFPFTVGYDVVGEVDAVGAGVKGFAIGDRVSALTVTGAQAESLTRPAEDFVKVPKGLDDAEVVALILNYVTAYQMIHRCTSLKAGDTALVTGANGGVGSALLELLSLLGVRTLGAASRKNFDFVKAHGAEPIASREGKLEDNVHAVIPEGVDVAFDGLGGRGTATCIRATKKGGTVVGYGFMDTTKNGKTSTFFSLLGFWSIFVGSFFAGRKGVFYGITKIYREDKTPFREDLPKLFALLAEKKIHPEIAERLPLLAGTLAQQKLEAGGFRGKIVLVRDLPS